MAKKLHWKTLAKLEREGSSRPKGRTEREELEIFMNLVGNVMDLTGMDWREALATVLTISKSKIPVIKREDAS
jgi:hypothetical protein